eukprot:COSAG01_NODE_1131_length_11572_cov_84.273337_4_plen_401_part_00
MPERPRRERPRRALCEGADDKGTYPTCAGGRHDHTSGSNRRDGDPPCRRALIPPPRCKHDVTEHRARAHVAGIARQSRLASTEELFVTSLKHSLRARLTQRNRPAERYLASALHCLQYALLDRTPHHRAVELLLVGELLPERCVDLLQDVLDLVEGLRLRLRLLLRRRSTCMENRPVSALPPHAFQRPRLPRPKLHLEEWRGARNGRHRRTLTQRVALPGECLELLAPAPNRACASSGPRHVRQSSVKPVDLGQRDSKQKTGAQACILRGHSLRLHHLTLHLETDQTTTTTTTTTTTAHGVGCRQRKRVSTNPRSPRLPPQPPSVSPPPTPHPAVHARPPAPPRRRSLRLPRSRLPRRRPRPPRPVPALPGLPAPPASARLRSGPYMLIRTEYTIPANVG